MYIRLVIFLLINFAALAIGGLSTGGAVSETWYLTLNKAPWTPPGWVFGAVWTSIMVCFSFFMAKMWEISQHKTMLLLLFSAQWILNVGWNPLFFSMHLVLLSLIVIVLLTGLVGFFFFSSFQKSKLVSLLVLPYFIWLMIASSLNAYIYLYN
jgi:tryptophan-rich sensory protein